MQPLKNVGFFETICMFLAHAYSSFLWLKKKKKTKKQIFFWESCGLRPYAQQEPKSYSTSGAKRRSPSSADLSSVCVGGGGATAGGEPLPAVG